MGCSSSQQRRVGSAPVQTVVPTVPVTDASVTMITDPAENSAREDKSIFVDMEIVVSFSSYMSQTNGKIDNYQFLHVIGKGSHATVYEVIDNKTEVHYAAKVYERIVANSQSETEESLKTSQMMAEQSALGIIQNCPNCIQLQEFFVDTNTRANIIILQFCDQGTILEENYYTKPIPEPEAKVIFRQAAQGIRFCHKNNIAHMDLKPQNILKCSNGNVVVADFSSSVLLSNNIDDKIIYNQSTSIAYSSPEISSVGPFNPFKHDVFCLGSTLFHMVYGRVLFANKSNHPYQMLSEIKKAEVDYTTDLNLSEDLIDLLKCMLRREPDERPSIEQVLSHRWLQEP